MNAVNAVNLMQVDILFAGDLAKAEDFAKRPCKDGL
jgi:hypothetical protein